MVLALDSREPFPSNGGGDRGDRSRPGGRVGTRFHHTTSDHAITRGPDPIRSPPIPRSWVRVQERANDHAQAASEPDDEYDSDSVGPRFEGTDVGTAAKLSQLRDKKGKRRSPPERAFRE